MDFSDDFNNAAADPDVTVHLPSSSSSPSSSVLVHRQIVSRVCPVLSRMLSINSTVIDFRDNVSTLSSNTSGLYYVLKYCYSGGFADVRDLASDVVLSVVRSALFVELHEKGIVVLRDSVLQHRPDVRVQLHHTVMTILSTDCSDDYAHKIVNQWSHLMMQRQPILSVCESSPHFTLFEGAISSCQAIDNAFEVPSTICEYMRIARHVCDKYRLHQAQALSLILQTFPLPTTQPFVCQMHQHPSCLDVFIELSMIGCEGCMTHITSLCGLVSISDVGTAVTFLTKIREKIIMKHSDRAVWDSLWNTIALRVVQPNVLEPTTVAFFSHLTDDSTTSSGVPLIDNVLLETMCSHFHITSIAETIQRHCLPHMCPKRCLPTSVWKSILLRLLELHQFSRVPNEETTSPLRFLIAMVCSGTVGREVEKNILATLEELMGASDVIASVTLTTLLALEVRGAVDAVLFRSVTEMVFRLSVQSSAFSPSAFPRTHDVLIQQQQQQINANTFLQSQIAIYNNKNNVNITTTTKTRDKRQRQCDAVDEPKHEKITLPPSIVDPYRALGYMPEYWKYPPPNFLLKIPEFKRYFQHCQEINFNE
eukprot:PhF_6_TR42728/c0_g1_i1/m.64564